MVRVTGVGIEKERTQAAPLWSTLLFAPCEYCQAPTSQLAQHTAASRPSTRDKVQVSASAVRVVEMDSKCGVLRRQTVVRLVCLVNTQCRNDFLTMISVADTTVEKRERLFIHTSARVLRQL